MGVAELSIAQVALDALQAGRGVKRMLDQKDRPNIIIGAEDSTSQVMTSLEAAEYLKMHVKTVCRLAKEGKIPAKKVGSEWRFLRSVLDGWLAETMV
jgi:excisionase family DNA binding protein